MLRRVCEIENKNTGIHRKYVRVRAVRDDLAVWTGHGTDEWPVFFVKLVTKNCLRNQASDTSGFSMLKCHHHFLGKADIIALIRNVFPVEPGGHGKLIVVYRQSVVAVQVAVKSKQKCSGE